jgi:hypothetical protein
MNDADGSERVGNFESVYFLRLFYFVFIAMKETSYRRAPYFILFYLFIHSEVEVACMGVLTITP